METLIYGCFRAKKPINSSLFRAKTLIIQLILRALMIFNQDISYLPNLHKAVVSRTEHMREFEPL